MIAQRAHVLVFIAGVWHVRDKNACTRTLCELDAPDSSADRFVVPSRLMQARCAKCEHLAAVAESWRDSDESDESDE